MEEYKAVSMPRRSIVLSDAQLLDKAEAFEKKHGGLVLVMESAAVLMGAAGLLRMLCGL